MYNILNDSARQLISKLTIYFPSIHSHNKVSISCTNLIRILDIDDLLALRHVPGDPHAERYPDLLVPSSLHGILELGILVDVEELGDEVSVLGRSLGEEQTAPVGVREQTDVHEDLVAEDVDVQLVRHVADQLHEEVALVQAVQLLTTAQQGARRPGGKRRVAFYGSC